MDKTLIDAISLIKSSPNKKLILSKLHNNILTPKEIADLTNIELNNVSSYLRYLKDNNLIICLNEEKKKGRLYQLTDLAIQALKKSVVKI